MDVFRNSIVDIDFDAVDPNDFRAQQLKDLASGVSKILIAVAKTEQDLVSGEIIKIAHKFAPEKPKQTA